MDNVIAYMDGFNLYFGLKSKNWRQYYWLDIPGLIHRLLKPNQDLIATKYFTSRVSSQFDPGKSKRQTIYLEALQALPGVTIYYGHYLQNPYTCHNCNARRTIHSEKMTDVNIATHLLTDAFLDRFDTALLISADSDLVPPVMMVRKLFPKKWITAVFPPGRFSKTLANAACASYHVGRDKVAASQLPDQIHLPSGIVLQRPPKWK